MARTLFVLFLCLLPAAKACECAKAYGLVCETRCNNGLKPTEHPGCSCCNVCPKLEDEECGGPYYSKGTCNEKLYCSAWGTYTQIDKEALLSNQTNTVGTCQPKYCVKACDPATESARICGTDKILYESNCHRRQKNCYLEDSADKVRKDPVKSNCPCYTGKCEKNGRQCVNGECVCHSEEHCDDLYEPVCDSNGVLYQSKCHANTAICKAPPGVKFTISNGTCEELNRCKNECTGQGQICEIKSGRFVGCVCQPPTMCQDDLPSFCATNGYAYRSRCYMDAHACKLKEEISFDHEGPCSAGPPNSSGNSSPPEFQYQ